MNYILVEYTYLGSPFSIKLPHDTTNKQLHDLVKHSTEYTATLVINSRHH